MNDEPGEAVSEPKIRVRPMCQADEARAARLERHYNWLYETNPEFRAQVDAMPSHEELLTSLALDGCWPPPEGAS